MHHQPSPTSRRRRRGAVMASVALLAAAPAFAPAPAAAAPGPCPSAFPVGQVTKGLRGTGYTVDQGTTPEPFSVEVIGVLEDGIAPDMDMIIVETNSAAIDDAGGIWFGMSGSPVYTADGRLLGAIAYGLSAGPSRIGGITPASAMYQIRDFPNAAANAQLTPEMREEAVSSGAATAEEASSRMRRLATPLAVSGLSAGRLDAFADRLDEAGLRDVIPHAASAVGTGTTAAASAIKPGGNFAGAIAVGDITAGGVGTTTAVCGQKVLAFGHPFTFGGSVGFRAHAADAMYVQPDSLFGPYKLANLRGAVGTLDQDRLAAIRATLGAVPVGTKVQSSVKALDTGLSRTGTSIGHGDDFVAAVAAFHLLANHDRVFQAINEGSSTIHWVIKGKKADGTAFTIDRTNKYASQFDIAFESIFELAGQIDRITQQPFTDVQIGSVTIGSTIEQVFRSYDISQVAVRQGGVYKTIADGDTVLAKPGGVVDVRVTLHPYRGRGADLVRYLSFAVPTGTAGRSGIVQINGGNGFFEEGPQPSSFGALITQLQTAPKNTDLLGRMSLFAEGGSATVVRRTATADKVVNGARSFNVQVR